MAFEKREMTGALFPNDKRGNDKAPGWRGYVIINGVEYELGGWDKQGRTQFISLSAKLKEERRDAEQPQQSISGQAQAKIRRPDPISSGRRNADMNDDIPF